MSMKSKAVIYTGNAYTLSNGATYAIIDEDSNRYKIRNCEGELAWYSKKNFMLSKDSDSNTDNITKIELELEKVEKHMIELRNQLENAKKSKTKNILERGCMKPFEGSIQYYLDDLCVALNEAGDFKYGLSISLSVNHNGYIDGLELDRDYHWVIDIVDDMPVLRVQDK